jgi:hypothetical protein
MFRGSASQFHHYTSFDTRVSVVLREHDAHRSAQRSRRRQTYLKIAPAGFEHPVADIQYPNLVLLILRHALAAIPSFPVLRLFFNVIPESDAGVSFRQ